MNTVRPDRIIRPWWEALPAETRAAIEAAVPDGHWITLTAGYRGKPGTADVRLRREGAVVIESRGTNLTAQCKYVLAYVAVDVAA